MRPEPLLTPGCCEFLHQDEQPPHLMGGHSRATLLSANALRDAGGQEWRNPKPLLVRQAERLVLMDGRELYLAYWPQELLATEPGLVLARVLPDRAEEVWTSLRKMGRDPGESAWPTGFHCWSWRGGRRNENDGPVVCDWSSSWCP